MEIYGNHEEGLRPEQLPPSPLVEITLCASQVELRSIAKFLEHCASEMDRMGPVYDHIHLSDHMKEFRSSPHLVVMRPEE
jgi:hypothetical protein